MYYYDIINFCLFNLGVTAVLRNIHIFVIQIILFILCMMMVYVGSRFYLY